MITLNSEQVEKALEYDRLIDGLKFGFKEDLGIPKRHHHDYPNPPGEDSSLLLMPAWKTGKAVGVKIVNVTPANGKRDLPSIHGAYLYFDGKTGIPLALMDSNMITKKRTAATSALASQFLARAGAVSLLMIGTGTMAPELIKAHCSVRNIKNVTIWGRNPRKAQDLSSNLNIPGVDIKATDDLEESISSSDIISAATLSKEPLVKGEWLRPGQHVDLVGSYRSDMREADDEVINRADIFIDSYGGAPVESGDLAIPLEMGIISIKDIKADLFELCRNRKPGRTSESQITCFKSVGHALEDLVAAQIVYEHFGEKKHSNLK